MILVTNFQILGLFNYTSTFSRYSNIPLTLHYLESLEDITDTTFFKPFQEKSLDIAPILYIQSNCPTFSNRDAYIEELGKYVNIDSYGSCLNNRTLSENLSKDYFSKIFSNEFYEFVSQYKFMIAYENAGCEDYITEKLWRNLKTGVVPIYFGSPSIVDWMPNEKSIVHVRDFESPQHLANFINYLNLDDEEYAKFLDHKYEGKISNPRLLNHKFNENNDNFVDELEGFVCENYEKILSEISIANQSHYNCPKDGFMPKYFDITDELSNMLKDGACEAKVLYDLMLINKPFNSEEFSSQLQIRFDTGKC